MSSSVASTEHVKYYIIKIAFSNTSGLILHRGNEGDCLCCPCSLPWCPWNALVEMYNFIIECLGVLALLKTKHTGLYITVLSHSSHKSDIVNIRVAGKGYIYWEIQNKKSLNWTLWNQNLSICKRNSNLHLTIWHTCLERLLGFPLFKYPSASPSDLSAFPLMA